MSRRPDGRDWTIAVGLTLLSGLAPRWIGPGAPEPVAAWAGLLGFGLVAAEGIPLAWRRIRPAAVAAVVVLAYATYGLAVQPAPPYAGWVALFAAAVHVPGLRRAMIVSGVVAAALVGATVGAAAVHSEGRNELPTLLLVTLVVLLAGLLTHAERDRVSALRERAASLEREQAAARGRAALEERLRIARDLHDVVGHGLGAITVQSGTARVALEAGDIAAVRAALGHVEATSRAAMQEMRSVVGVLRERASDAPEADLSVAGLPALVQQAGRAGVRTNLEWAGDPVVVPPVVGRCAYRVVQEALTNVARHAPGAAATVRLDAQHDWLRVEVADRGGDRARPTPGSGGHGLVGMRERVELLHGSMQAGPRDGGGWTVQVSLPLREGTEA